MEYQEPEPYTVEVISKNLLLSDNLGQTANAHVAHADKEAVAAMTETVCD